MTLFEWLSDNRELVYMLIIPVVVLALMAVDVIKVVLR